MKEYFSHDYNARNDKQLVKLHMKKGLSGIGAYWCIVEMLYEEGGYLNIDEYERITFELRTDYDLIKSVIEEFDLFKNDDIRFWSETALFRLQERMAKSQKARESVQKRWNKLKNNTNVLRTYDNRNTIKVKESKVNEYIYNQFYDSELKKSNNDKKYEMFIKMLFGENEEKRKLTGILKIENQLTFDNFNKILAIKPNDIFISDILLKIENDSKYYKGKKSLYRTLLNWVNLRFVK